MTAETLPAGARSGRTHTLHRSVQAFGLRGDAELLQAQLSASVGADAPPTPEMPKVQAPVLMFHGLRDTALHSDGLAGTWNWVAKDLTLVTVPEAGHFVQQDAADLVTTTMKWWLASRLNASDHEQDGARNRCDRGAGECPVSHLENAQRTSTQAEHRPDLPRQSRLGRGRRLRQRARRADAAPRQARRRGHPAQQLQRRVLLHGVARGADDRPLRDPHRRDAARRHHAVGNHASPRR